MDLDSSSDDDDITDHRLHTLQTHIQQHPYHYNSHVQYITALRHCLQLDELEKARLYCQSLFLLTEDVWIEWIQDHLNMGNALRVLELYQQAFADYYSVKLWSDCLNFVEQQYKDEELPWDVALGFFEAAADSLGNDFQNAHSFWKQYIEIEPVDKNQLVIRAVSVPCARAETIYQECKAIFEGDANELQKIHEHTMQRAEIRKGYEDRITAVSKQEYTSKSSSDNSNRLNVWSEYLQFLRKTDRAQNWDEVFQDFNVFERAIHDLHGQESIWCKYIAYIQLLCVKATPEQGQELLHSRLSVCSRSVKNCRNSSQLWQMYLWTVCEASRLLDLDMSASDVFERAVTNDLDRIGFVQLCYTFCCFLLKLPKTNNQERTLRSILDRSIGYIQLECESSGLLSRTSLSLMNLVVEADVGVFSSMDNARTRWNSVVRYCQTDPGIWKAYLDFEKRYGDLTHLRSLYDRAINVFRHNDMSVVKQLLLDYRTDEEKLGEASNVWRIHGRLEGLQYSKSIQVSRKRQRSGDVEEEEDVKKKKKKPKVNQEDEMSFEEQPRTAMVTNAPFTISEDEIRSIFEQVGPVEGILIQLNRKQMRTGVVFVTFEKDEDVEKAINELNESKIQDRLITIRRSRIQKGKQVRIPKVGVEPHVVLVVNIPADTTSSDLEQHFSSIGGVTGVRFVKKKRKSPFKTKAAFVEFETPELANKAIEELQKSILGGEVLKLTISTPRSKGAAKVLGKDLVEPRKVFVKNIDRNSDVEQVKEELTNLFSKCGEIKDLRLLFKGQYDKFRGSAFVEFADDKSCEAAILLNNTQFMNSRIKVQRSRPAGVPPSRNPRGADFKHFLPARSKAKQRIGKMNSHASGKDNMKKMTNADFRALLKK